VAFSCRKAARRLSLATIPWTHRLIRVAVKTSPSTYVQTQRSPCFVCGEAALAERTQTAAFRLCPACARLLRWLRTRLSEDSELRFSSISLASSFADDIRIDSLSMIEFIRDLEQESGVKISDDTVAEVRTVQDVVRYVRLRSAG
jgi:acyl carrier protein